jgi:hypothetical protein
MWYLGIDSNNRPNGWDTVPWGNAFPVSDAVRAIHIAHPDYVWDGATLSEYVPPVQPPEPEYIPTQISMRQARLILLQYGLLDTVSGIVAGLPQNYQIEWEYAQYAERSNPLIGMVATAAGMTTEQIDAMFLAGSQL